VSAENGHTPQDPNEGLALEAQALKVQLASIRKLCESGWPRGEPCRLCKQVGSHTPNCYVRASVGYDLLAEHEATLRENDQLRAALAQHLPVNGKHITTGGKFRSLRDRARGGRFSAHDD
jgi:hypothetical protein